MNYQSWLTLLKQHRAIAVGLAGDLFPKKQMVTGNWEAIVLNLLAIVLSSRTLVLSLRAIVFSLRAIVHRSIADD